MLLTLKSFDVCTVTMGVACPLLQRSIYALDTVDPGPYRKQLLSGSASMLHNHAAEGEGSPKSTYQSPESTYPTGYVAWMAGRL